MLDRSRYQAVMPEEQTLLRQLATIERLSEPSSESRPEPLSRLAQLRAFLLRRLFLLVIVVIPTLASIVYYGLLLSDRYVSEARFVVRQPGGAGAGALSELLKASGVGGLSLDDAVILSVFLQSQDVLDLLVTQDHYLEVLSREEADLFSRYPVFWAAQNRNRLLATFRRYVSVSVDNTSKIATLTVEAFRPSDAQDVARALLRHSENFINEMNARSQRDAVANARAHFDLVQSRAKASEDQLTAFREKSKIIDPGSEFKSAITVITNLTMEMAKINSQITAAERQSAEAPALSKLRERAKALNGEIDKQRMALAGGAASLAPVFATFERLTLEREFAGKALAGALLELDAAQQDAKKQKLYVETVAKPDLPDKSTQPQRFLGIVMVLLVVVPLYVVVERLLGNLLEHAAWAKPKAQELKS